MSTFALPTDLLFNTGRIDDVDAYARERQPAAWLCLTGTEFAAIPGGLAFADVQAAVPASTNIPSDPPRTLDLALARQHVAALDALPRPTLVSCRMGPRSSAVAYMYAGLRAGAAPADVIAAAEAAEAPFVASAELKAWVTSSIEALRGS